jgi:hypothetical protein
MNVLGDTVALADPPTRCPVPLSEEEWKAVQGWSEAALRLYNHKKGKQL